MQGSLPTGPVTTRVVAELPVDDVVATLNAAFSGYVIPFSMTSQQFEARFRSEHLDPFASHVWAVDGVAAAIVLIARRGWVSRVAAVGVCPAMRGTGLGTETMRHAVAAAKARGDTELVLEVFESNVAAVKLYRRAGFAEARRLYGFTIDGVAKSPVDAMPLTEIDPALGATHAGRFRIPGLPWQLDPATLAATVRPARCFVNAARSIVAMVANVTDDAARLRALAFDPAISAADAAAFTASLRATLPGRAWNAPQIYPEPFGSRFFEPGGWTPAELAQFEMRHPLGGN